MKRLNKFISYALVLTMLISIMPADIFANTQTPIISGITLVNNNVAQGYSLTVKWTAPPISVNDVGVIDDGATVYNAVDTAPQGYNINVKNMVLDENEIAASIDNINGTSSDAGIPYQETIMQDFVHGFLYRINVQPYHYHDVPDATGVTQVIAPTDGTRTVKDSAFFLSDIAVEGTGEGNTLYVTWDNPSELITSYFITYSKISDDTSEIAQATVTVDTTINDPNLEIIADTTARGGTRYRYAITNSRVISPANMYDITLEPLFSDGTTYSVASTSNALGAVLKDENNSRVSVTARSEGKYYCTATTDLPLSIYEVDSDNIKLVWSGLDTATVSKTEKLEILQSATEAFENYTVVGTLLNQGAKIGSWIIPKPKEVIYYKVVVKFKNEDGRDRPPMSSVIIEYNPSLVPFKPNKPDILYLQPIIENGIYTLDLIWNAFIRQPYSDAEVLDTEDGTTYIDRKVKYDVWLTDSMTSLYSDNLLPIFNDLDAADITSLVYEYEGDRVEAYQQVLSEYTQSVDGLYSNVSIVPNKLYYLKIVATKTFSGVDYKSEPEYRLVYFNDTGNIFTPPMISKPPLKIKEDSTGKEMVSQTTVTIEWKKEWWEIFNMAADVWESKFDISGGSLLFGNAVEDEGILVKKEEDIINKVILQTSDTVYYRPVILDEEVKYEYLVVPYAKIEEFANLYYPQSDLEDRTLRAKIYSDYINKRVLSAETGKTSIFTQIPSPLIEQTDTQKNTLYTSIENLEVNTEYVVLFRAYRTATDGKLLKSDPNYLTFTTLPLDKELIEIPTVPNLYLQTKDDISITVKWRDDGFKYELAVSEKPMDDPTSAELIIPTDKIDLDGEKIILDTEIGEDAVFYKINGLFPATQYFIWVRAVSDTAPKPSAWSSPLQVSTESLTVPDVPDGLGVASKESLLYVNDVDKTDYIPVSTDYLAVEWMKDANDELVGYSSTASKDEDGMLGAPEITATMLAKFGNLITNKYYFVRVATRVVVTKSGKLGDGITKKYSYKVELADNADFKDAIVIEVPEEFNPAGEEVYRMEISEYCTAIRILTAPDGSEFDSDVDPDLYPLPDEDYELVYDSKTKTLTYRIRSNEKDDDNMPDNRVDQRLITKLIQKGINVYTVNVTRYGNNTISNRVVEVPYTVVQAFSERDISLEIIADNMSFVLKPDWLSSTVKNSLVGYGDSSKLRVTIKQGTKDIYPFVSTNSATYISTAQQVSMAVVTPRTTKTIEYTASPIQIALRLSNRYDMYDKNVDAYSYNGNSGEWLRENADYNSQTAELSFRTNKVTAYTAVAVQAPLSNQSSESFKAIANKLNIVDMNMYKADQKVTADQLNNLLYSVAMNEKDIRINKSVTSTQKKLLAKSGLALSGSGLDEISRQEAISNIVKLYEIKTGSSITVPKNTSIADIASVAAEYKNSILKAEKIGMVEETVRANDNITLDEMSYMLNILLEDIG